MKRLFVSLIALFALSSADAQILDALKKVATEAVTEVVDNATDGALTQLAIIGTWSYTAPAVKLDGEDTLTSLSGSALSATLGKKLESAFTKVGITADACSVTFNSDGTFTMPIKNRNLTGTYTYNSEDHSLIMVIGQIKSIEMKGYAFINGTTGLQLVFHQTADAFTVLEADGGELISQNKAAAVMAVRKTGLDHFFAETLVIGAGGVKVIKTGIDKRVHHGAESVGINLIALHGQAHTAKAEILLDFGEKTIHSSTSDMSFCLS